MKSLDDVAFVRYASVYRDFSHAEDFEKVISEINAKIARDPLESLSDAGRADDEKFMAAAIELSRPISDRPAPTLPSAASSSRTERSSERR